MGNEFVDNRFLLARCPWSGKRHGKTSIRSLEGSRGDFASLFNISIVEQQEKGDKQSKMQISTAVLILGFAAASTMAQFGCLDVNNTIGGCCSGNFQNQAISTFPCQHISVPLWTRIKLTIH